MNSILRKIVDWKVEEVRRCVDRVPLSELQSKVSSAPPVRDFHAALSGPGISLIAEVKKASPSKGLIREDFDPVAIAHSYQRGGASCVSVLTDEHFFQGHLDFLTACRAEIELPLLRKDFILDEYQIYEARVAGADAVLLIAECLAPDRLRLFHDRIVSLGMTPLVELYDPANLEAVLRCNPQLVGVNNRDLNTFDVNLQHTVQMRKKIPGSVTLVGESGIFTNADATLLENAGVNAMLVGESLMRQEDPELAVRRLLGSAGESGNR